MTNLGVIGNPSTWALNEGSIIPGEFQIKPVSQGVRMATRVIRRQCDTQMPITPSTTDIRWKIPSSNVITLDFRRGGIHVFISCAVNAPHSVRLPNFAWNMFSRFRMQQHNQDVEDKLYFNQVETFKFWTTVLKDQFRTTAVGLYGAGSPASRAALSAGAEYTLPIPTDALCRTVLPWFQLIETGKTISSSNLPDVTMIWDMASPYEFLECYGNNGVPVGLTYTITLFEIEYNEITFEGNTTREFLKAWHTTPGQWARLRWETYQTFVYPLSTSLNQVILVDSKVKALESIVVLFRFSSLIANPLSQDKYETWIGPTSGNVPLLEYQWELNNQLWPDQPVSLSNGTIDAYKKFLELFGNYFSRFVHAEVTAIGPYQFGLDKFLIAYDGHQFPFTTNIITPVSTENSTKNVSLRLRFSVAPPAGMEVLVLVSYWRQWKFAAPPGRIVEW